MRHTTPGPDPGQGVGTTVNNTYTYSSSTTCIYLVITQLVMPSIGSSRQRNTVKTIKTQKNLCTFKFFMMLLSNF